MLHVHVIIPHERSAVILLCIWHVHVIEKSTAVVDSIACCCYAFSMLHVHVIIPHEKSAVVVDSIACFPFPCKETTNVAACR